MNAAVETPLPLIFSEAAAAKVRQLIDEEGNSALKLRIFVQGGGCSGFQYGFTFDDRKPTDYHLRVRDIDVVVDRASALKLHNATVDYIEDFRGAGFSVENPNATASCGCGKSFS